MLQGIVNRNSAQPQASDPFFSSVVLLMGFEGANGSTGAPGMTDESPAAHGTATMNGSAAISTAQFKFGSSSARVTGSGTQDIIYFADSADWNLAAGNFTIECFIRPVTLAAGRKFIVNQWGGGTTHAFTFYLDADQLGWDVSTTGANIFFDITSATGLIVTNTQYHVCVDYDGTKYRMYIGGTMVGSSSTARTIFDSTTELNIGGNLTSLLNFYDGYIDELRITKGIARYASDSGLTPPTARFPRS